MADCDELEKLGELHRNGVLTDEEFSRAKARVLGGMTWNQPRAAPAASPLNALHRSRSDRWLGGVCGGLGELTGTPSWLWRLSFVLLVLCVGTGILFYLLMCIFVPLEPYYYSPRQAAS